MHLCVIGGRKTYFKADDAHRNQCAFTLISDITTTEFVDKTYDFINLTEVNVLIAAQGDIAQILKIKIVFVHEE